MTRISTLPRARSLFDMEFIFRLPICSLFMINNSTSSIFFSLIVTLLLKSILLPCLVLAEKSKPCLQFSLPKFLLPSLVSQISLLKMKPFKMSTRLLANIEVLSLFKCNPSFHRHSLVMLSLLIKWNLLLLHYSRKWSLTCLMILVSLNCLLTNIEEIISIFILILFPHSVSYNLKSDTRGPVIDFNFSHRILMLLHTWPISIKANYLKNVFNCLKTVLNWNSNSHCKIVLNLS